MLMAAASNSSEPLVKLLIAYGASAGAKDKNGLTAAVWAGEDRHPEIEAYLRSVGKH